MSGRELDWDGTDSYHPEHPWEQSGHPAYIYPTRRTLANWPPEAAQPAGMAEAAAWRSLPEFEVNPQNPAEWHNLDNCGPTCTGWHLEPGLSNSQVGAMFGPLDPCRCVCHRPRISD